MTGTDTRQLAALRPRLPSPLHEVADGRFERHGVRLLLKRDDLIHPELVGNKWRKLAPNLATADGRTVVTFGGAYSNHLRAAAAAGRLLGLPTVGVVRGQELAGLPLNPSLARCAADGMR
ncbi:1-aminocyclopropane-1-carboxylate deaminase, partial [Streptomyces rubrogriseus]|nr:1-aminocyclopropane-1-carboxylate deaminase [Streptomyces rubrogriseus]